ncbi:MAG: hypothetical protein V4631_24330 [Pseudomonadota bacterium]
MMLRPWSKAVLFAASMLLHVAVLVLFLRMPEAGSGKDSPSKAIDVVWIRTPPVPAPVAAAPPVTAPRAITRTRVRPSAVRRVVPDNAPTVVADVAPPPTEGKVFDHAAALDAARKMAGKPDAERLATVGGQIEARQAVSETEDEKLGRQIANGKRTSCLKPNGGGSLLSPLMWLLDKKDSGCKF